jgi:hypothetical protein
MEQMVEPDRTILIVSIIGLVIIWGSVAYHKFVQGGGPAEAETGPSPSAPAEASASPPDAGGPSRRRGRKR